MKKIILIALALTLLGFIPFIHQETKECSVFGYDHLTPPGVVSVNLCTPNILAITMAPGIQVSHIFHFNSVYENYLLLGITNVAIYIIVGYIILQIKKFMNTLPEKKRILLFRFILASLIIVGILLYFFWIFPTYIFSVGG